LGALKVWKYKLKDNSEKMMESKFKVLEKDDYKMADYKLSMQAICQTLG
jgi:hypothetical protein